jgi:hypothetical protein
MARGWVSFWTDIDGVVILILFLDMLLINHIRERGKRIHWLYAHLLGEA